jgi:hypothetical protein
MREPDWTRLQPTEAWQMLVARAEAEAVRPAYEPTTELPERGERDVRIANVCAPLVRAGRHQHAPPMDKDWTGGSSER